MNNKGTIQKLHDKGIIDKKYLFWWQLGFEGRRVFSEEEFESNLVDRTWDVYVKFNPEEKSRKNFRLWKGDDVPILIKNINIEGLEVSCFVSIKPVSHWPTTDINEEREFSVGVYEQPHIRGLVAHLDDKFLFWYPFAFGTENQRYSTRAILLKDTQMPIIIWPVCADNFYRNLIGINHRGKRAQTKASVFDYNKEGFEIVPYFDFDLSKNHIMLYPVSIQDDRLSSPVLVKTNNSRPEILGVGYPDIGQNVLKYWHLNAKEIKRAKNDLMRAFG